MEGGEEADGPTCRIWRTCIAEAEREAARLKWAQEAEEMAARDAANAPMTEMTEAGGSSSAASSPHQQPRDSRPAEWRSTVPTGGVTNVKE